MHAPTGGPPVTTCLCRDLHPVMCGLCMLRRVVTHVVILCVCLMCVCNALVVVGPGAR
jgi:hypothetical protein